MSYKPSLLILDNLQFVYYINFVIHNSVTLHLNHTRKKRPLSPLTEEEEKKKERKRMKNKIQEHEYLEEILNRWVMGFSTDRTMNAMNVEINMYF